MFDDSAFPGIPLLRGVTEMDIERLKLRFIPVRVSQGQCVVSLDDPGRDVFFVLSGRLLAVHWTFDGREIVFSRIMAGSHLGEVAALDGKARSTSVYAQTECELLRLDQAGFKLLVDRVPMVRDRVFANLCALVRQLTRRASEIQTQPVEGRLRLFLARIALESRCLHRGGLIDPAPTHAEIANSIGANREAVSRGLSALARQGILKTGRSKIHLLQPEALMPEGVPLDPG